MFRYLLINLILLPFSIRAQQYLDLARVSYATTPTNNFETGSGGTHISEWQLQLNLPLPINDKLVLLNGFSGHGSRLRLDPSTPDPANLSAVALEMGLNQRFSEAWSATYMVIPKLATDFNTSFRKSFQLALLTLITHTKTDSLSYSYGLYANSEAYGWLFVPLIGFYYQSPDKQLEANFLLPVRADLNYGLGPDWRIGISFDGLGTSYAINNPDFSDSYVNKASNELFAYLQYALGPSLLIRFKTGYAFFRAYKVYDNADKIDFSISSIYFGDDRTILNSGLQDGFIIKAEAVYRLRF